MLRQLIMFNSQLNKFKWKNTTKGHSHHQNKKSNDIHSFILLFITFKENDADLFSYKSSSSTDSTHL